MAHCLIGLGSNLGDRGALLTAARDQLAALPETALLKISSFRDSKPAGGPAAQPPYLNAAVTLETALSPLQLLHELQRIENELGRERIERWGPRTIDLDVLLYDQLELEIPELTLPHPRMSFRRFVLEPAVEIAGEMVYPINHSSIMGLHDHLILSDDLLVLAPTHSTWSKHSPATRLLKALGGEHCDFLPLTRREFESENQPRSSRKNRRHTLPIKSATGQQTHKRRSKWSIADFWNVQLRAEELAQSSEFDTLIEDSLGQDPWVKLVVVWQPEDAPVLDLLDRVRRSPESPPVLWIPKVSLQHAVQEVIAAMAAMS